MKTLTKIIAASTFVAAGIVSALYYTPDPKTEDFRTSNFWVYERFSKQPSAARRFDIPNGSMDIEQKENGYSLRVEVGSFYCRTYLLKDWMYKRDKKKRVVEKTHEEIAKEGRGYHGECEDGILKVFSADAERKSRVVELGRELLVQAMRYQMSKDFRTDLESMRRHLERKHNERLEGRKSNLRVVLRGGDPSVGMYSEDFERIEENEDSDFYGD